MDRWRENCKDAEREEEGRARETERLRNEETGRG
jgi:hypothetical protein